MPFRDRYLRLSKLLPGALYENRAAQEPMIQFDLNYRTGASSDQRQESAPVSGEVFSSLADELVE